MPMRNYNHSWVFPKPISVPLDLKLAVGGSSLVAKTLFRRGLSSPEEALAFLDPDCYTPCPPSALPGIDKAADRIIQAVDKKQQILIWGDFDVDGQTSTTLLVSSLQKIGAIVKHHIPIRAEESHGVSLPVLSRIIQEDSPDLIITCDTGIDAYKEVDFANESGVDVIVTDHHQLPPTLPAAYAIINPNMLGPDHVLFSLPGVGVAFKLIEAVFHHFGEDPSFLLDLVALGIVADLAEQTGDTRYLLQKGLEVLRKTPRLGLQEICQQNNLDPGLITEEDIGFIIGPRLNALGRLDDANSCVEFFTTSDPSEASRLATQLEELNNIRKTLTQEIYDQAENMLSAYPELDEQYPILVLQGSPKWNPGVIGIVASRLVERYSKPVIMLSQDGEEARGSARSIPGVPISDLISDCEDLLISHGGHPMAAGLSLPLSNVSQFRRSLTDSFQKIIGDSLPDIAVQIDAEIPFQVISESYINDFQRLSPFGAGNPKLTFATRGVYTSSNQIKTIGRSGNHQKVTFTDANGDQLDFLWWNSSDLSLPEMPADIAYTLELSTFRGQIQIQSTLTHLRNSPGAPVYIPVQHDIALVDLRKAKQPLDAIKSHYLPTSSIVWAENITPEGFPSVTRSSLSNKDNLIIWTTPPSKLILSEAVEKVSPNRVIFVGIHPQIISLKDFIQSLLGLIKHLTITKKTFDLTRFSEALAVPEDLIEAGLEWIHQQGDYNLEEIQESIVLPGPGHNLSDFTAIDKTLKIMLREMFAYHSYFANAHIKAIL